jgi:hypothetical protein
VIQHPRVLEQPPHFTPFLAADLADRFGHLLLSPRLIMQLPIGAPQGNRCLDAVHRRFGRYGLVKDALGLTPCLMGSSSSPRASLPRCLALAT